MKPNVSFHYSNFFSIPGIFKDWFDGYENAWEVLPEIDNFINIFKKLDEAVDYKEVSPDLFIGKNVTIDDTARITGRAIIGHNSTIGHAAFLRDGVLLGENVHVGHATELKHSIVLQDSALAHLNYVGDSIIGSNVNIAGGATLANYRLDQKEVAVKFENILIPTHLQKFGSVIGDNCRIGVNAVLNPGTILGKNTLVFPLKLVKGTHLEKEIIK